MSGSFAVIISIRYCLLQCWMRVGQQSSGVNIDETAIVMPVVLGVVLLAATADLSSLLIMSRRCFVFCLFNDLAQRG